MAKKKKKKKQHRFFWFMIKFQIFLMIIVLGGLGYYFFGGYAGQVQKLRSEAVELVKQSDKNTFVPARTSLLYDTNGKLISETASEKDAEYVKYEDIPANFVTAMVSIEDKKFYSHNGVDYKAIIRAAKAIIQDGKVSQGGSTITMQLARNIYLDTGKTWQRKVKEIFIAMQLEKKYSKNDIMEFYLNNIYFANGYYGIEAACHGYFNCELKDLDLSQTAFLCSIPNSPTYYDPIVNQDHTIKRRNLILKNMREDGKITQAEYEKAVSEEIVLNVSQSDDTVKNNYVDTYAYFCATEALMENEGFKFKYYFDSTDDEKKYDESYDELYSYCQKKLYSEGYKIYTSIDLDKQEKLQDSVDTALADFTDVTDDGMYKLQGAAVSIDNSNGYVVAIVGGRSQDFTNHTLNRAFQSHRQPGSSIKPLIVYTPAFENGYTPDSVVDDHKFDGGPSNAGDTYHGDVTIRYAVEQSLNTVAWQVYEDVTPEKGLKYLKNMNFTNIVDSDYTIATALGGFTTGTSPLEDGIAHVLGIGTVLTAVQILDERKYPLLHDRVHSACVKVMEHRPLQLSAINLPLADLHFIRKNALEGQTQHGTLFGAEIVSGIQIMDKHQIRNLLDDIQWVHQAACSENIPQAVNSIFQFACNHINQSPYSKYKRYSGHRRF